MSPVETSSPYQVVVVEVPVSTVPVPAGASLPSVAVEVWEVLPDEADATSFGALVDKVLVAAKAGTERRLPARMGRTPVRIPVMEHDARCLVVFT